MGKCAKCGHPNLPPEGTLHGNMPWPNLLWDGPPIRCADCGTDLRFKTHQWKAEGVRLTINGQIYHEQAVDSDGRAYFPKGKRGIPRLCCGCFVKRRDAGVAVGEGGNRIGPRP